MMQSPQLTVGAALYTSAEAEHREPLQGRVSVGSVPRWLSGSLIRNGPALYEVGDTAYQHFFDGLAMLQKFSFSDGGVSYSSQFVRSDTYQANMEKRRIVISEFGTAAYDDPCKSLLGKLTAYFWPSEEEARLRKQMTDNTLVNVFPIGDQVFAATETTKMNRIDPASLDRLQLVDIGELVTVNTITAHPHFDADGSVYNLGTAFAEKSGPSYAIVRIPKGQLDNAEVVAKIPARWRWNPAYYHSFGITEKYFIFVESPLALRMLHLMTSMMLRRTADSAICWHDGYDSLFHVYNRHDGSHVQTISSPPFFTFHHMNAFECGDDEIVVDVCAFDNGNVIHKVTLENMRQMTALEGEEVQLRRYRLKLGSCEPATFTTPGQDVALEFPQINYRFNARPYRYGYGVGRFREQSDSDSRVMKVDWQGGGVKTWQEGGCYPSEAVFVERPGASAEDDGVLLTSVIRVSDTRSLFLLILDATSMEEVARVEIDGVSVPRDIHGMFFSEEQLRRAEAAATAS